MLKPRYKLIDVRRGPPGKKMVLFLVMNASYYDTIVPLKDGGVMILRPLTTVTKSRGKSI